MRNPFVWGWVLATLFFVSACGEVASTGEVKIVIADVSSRDVLRTQLWASAPVLPGVCVEGPCQSNPCDDELPWCIALATQFVCECAPGTHLLDGACVDDEICLTTTCAGHGECLPDLACECDPGYTGQRCEVCDVDAGYVFDGRGSCVKEPPPCREREGATGFSEFVQAANDSLGHPANEIDIVSARITAVDGSAAGVRAWNYLWNDTIEVFVSPSEGVFLTVGRAPAPEETDGLSPIEVPVELSRASLAAYPAFLEGEFEIGVRGRTERNVAERFHVDVEIELGVESF